MAFKQKKKRNQNKFEECKFVEESQKKCGIQNKLRKKKTIEIIRNYSFYL